MYQIGYGAIDKEEEFYQKLKELCTQHGLLFARIDRLTPRPSPVTSRKLSN